MSQLLQLAWQSVEPRWVWVETLEEDWEKRRERRHLWERLSACYFCHLQELANFKVVSAQREKMPSPESRVPGSWSGARGSHGKARGGSSVGGGQLGVEGGADPGG